MQSTDKEDPSVLVALTRYPDSSLILLLPYFHFDILNIWYNQFFHDFLIFSHILCHFFPDRVCQPFWIQGHFFGQRCQNPSSPYNIILTSIFAGPTTCMKISSISHKHLREAVKKLKRTTDDFVLKWAVVQAKNLSFKWKCPSAFVWNLYISFWSMTLLTYFWLNVSLI